MHDAGTHYAQARTQAHTHARTHEASNRGPKLKKLWTRTVTRPQSSIRIALTPDCFCSFLQLLFAFRCNNVVGTTLPTLSRGFSFRGVCTDRLGIDVVIVFSQTLWVRKQYEQRRPGICFLLFPLSRKYVSVVPHNALQRLWLAPYSFLTSSKLRCYIPL